MAALVEPFTLHALGNVSLRLDADGHLRSSRRAASYWDGTTLVVRPVLTGSESTFTVTPTRAGIAASVVGSNIRIGNFSVRTDGGISIHNNAPGGIAGDNLVFHTDDARAGVKRVRTGAFAVNDGDDVEYVGDVGASSSSSTGLLDIDLGGRPLAAIECSDHAYVAVVAATSPSVRIRCSGQARVEWAGASSVYSITTSGQSSVELRFELLPRSIDVESSDQSTVTYVRRAAAAVASVDSP